MSRTGTADSTLLTSATVSTSTSTSATPLSSDIEDDDETTDADHTGTDAEKDGIAVTPRIPAGRFPLEDGPQSPTGTIRGPSPPATMKRPTSPPTSSRGENAKSPKGQKEQNYGTDHDPSKKRQSVITRIIWSLVMVSGFIGTSLPARSAGLGLTRGQA